MPQSSPTITKQPTSLVVFVGSTVTLSINTVATPPPTFQWKKFGKAIAGAILPSLTLDSVTLTDAGSYSCTVTNKNGSATSSVATLVVQQVTVPPVITQQPLSFTIGEGSSIAFTVSVSGSTPLAYQWQKNGSNILSATTARLSLTSVAAADAGSYRCVVTNGAGTVTSDAAVLTVTAAVQPPVITSSPVDTTIEAGQSATLSIAATGTQPLMYQWYLNTTALPDETGSTLVVNTAGTYHCVVTNAAGSATSTDATVSVNAVPDPTTSFATMTARERLLYVLGDAANDPSITPVTHDLETAKNPLLEVVAGVTVAAKDVSDRVSPYQVGALSSFNSDYNSDGGCVAYVPDDGASPGLMGLQLSANYQGCFATSPRPEPNFSPADPDPATRRTEVLAANGGVPPKFPLAVARPTVMTSNGAVVLSSDGLIYAESTHTGSAGTSRTCFKFPSSKVPLDLCVTHGNELILVAVHDKERDVGQLAVLAIEGAKIPAHTLHCMGLFNMGSYTAFKLLGYVDLPFGWPTRVSAASNGYWRGPSETAGLDSGYIPIDRVMPQPLMALEDVVAGPVHMAQVGDHMEVGPVTSMLAANATIDRSVLAAKDPVTGRRPTGIVTVYDATRQGWMNLLNGTTVQSSWNRVLARKMYALVASTGNNKIAFVNLSALATYFRSWVSSPAAYDANAVGQAAGTWPATFDQRTDLLPTVDSTFDVDTPVSVLCGAVNTQAGNTDKIKAYVGLRDGTLINYDTTKLVLSSGGSATVTELGRNFIGANPVHMIWSRHNDGSGNSIFPAGQTAGCYHSAMYVTCRGERSVKHVVTYLGNAAVLRELSDSRLTDPVAAFVAERTYLVHVADHEGRQVIGFRANTITDGHHSPALVYPPTDASGVDITGVVSVAGKPLALSGANIN